MAKFKNTYWVLAVAFLSYFALGLPEGAFGLAWPFIREDMGLPLDIVGIILVSSSVAYAATSALLGRISAFLKLEYIILLGAILMAIGLLVRTFSTGFTMLAILIVVSNIGSGMVDPSLNSYMTSSFSSRYINWLHCSWGIGATMSPILVAQIILISDWRFVYTVLGGIQVIVVLIILMSILKGVWKKEKSAVANVQETKQASEKTTYLTRKRHQVMDVFTCFIHGGVQYSMGFWTVSVLLESRGVYLGYVGLFPAVFFGSAVVGGIIFGFLANRMSNISMIRVGMAMSFVGVVVLLLTNSLLGMVLMGLGFAPIFPCFLHGTKNRFSPEKVTKMIGYKVAALASGVAILSSLKGLVLARISLEALFPIAMILIALTFLMNEILEKNSRKSVV